MFHNVTTTNSLHVQGVIISDIISDNWPMLMSMTYVGQLAQRDSYTNELISLVCIN